jgi:hypothetical protein
VTGNGAMVFFASRLRGAPRPAVVSDGPGLATRTTKGPGADDRSRNSTNLRGARLGVSITAQGDEAMSMLHELS